MEYIDGGELFKVKLLLLSFKQFKYLLLKKTS